MVGGDVRYLELYSVQVHAYSRATTKGKERNGPTVSPQILNADQPTVNSRFWSALGVVRQPLRPNWMRLFSIRTAIR